LLEFLLALIFLFSSSQKCSDCLAWICVFKI
jgi:hypothetical protein